MRRLTQLGSRFLPSGWGFESLSTTWKFLLVLGVFAALINLGIGAWDEHQARSIPERASATAAVLYEAVRSCRMAALPQELEDCAAADAKLPEERAAVRRAQEAMQAHLAFYARCQKRNATAECEELVRRGWVIYGNHDRARKGGGR